MMLEKIKEIKLAARKARDAKLLEAITFIQGELERKGSNISDTEVFKVLDTVHVQFIESDKYLSEVAREFIAAHKPENLTHEEIKAILNTQIPDLRLIMKFFKDTYPSQYDGKELKTLTDLYIRNFNE